MKSLQCHYLIQCRIVPPPMIEEWEPESIRLLPDGYSVETLVTRVERLADTGWEDAGAIKQGDVIYPRVLQGPATLRFLVATIPAKALWVRHGLDLLGIATLPKYPIDGEPPTPPEREGDSILRKIATNLRPPKGYEAYRASPFDDASFEIVSPPCDNPSALCTLWLQVQETEFLFPRLAKIGRLFNRIGQSSIKVSGQKIKVKKETARGWYGPTLTLEFDVPRKGGSYRFRVKAHEEVFDRSALDAFLAEFPVITP